MTRIGVTADDIANGTRQASNSCPIVFAIKRAVPGSAWVEVDDRAMYNLDCTSYRAYLPADALGFIDSFDAGDPVEPFAFEAEFLVNDDDMGDE